MFKKKVWKRGDKLNAKELNRIEEGIAASSGSTDEGNGGNSIVLTFDIIADNQVYTAANFSLDTDTLINAVKNHQDVKVIGIRNQDTDDFKFTYFYLCEYVIFETGYIMLFKPLNQEYELTIGVDDSESIIDFTHNSH